MATSSMITIVVLGSLVSFGETSAFLSAQPVQVSTVDAETSLVSELAGTVSKDRLLELEDALRPTYDSLPKGADGQLGHQAVRYVLHRLFVKRHSWYIKGLEPSDEVPPPYLGGEWVPAYLQGILEQRLSERGINLRELAALAAALEDLVHREAGGQLASVYELHGLSKTSLADTKTVNDILSTYMMLYLRGGNFTLLAPEDLQSEKERFATNYADWPMVEEFLHDIEQRHMNVSYERAFDFASTSRMAGEISEKFGSFNDRECRNLKTTLLEIEDKQLGRVRLSAFYEKGLYSHWQFNEKIGYLRAIGAVDESDTTQARVILPNYLTSRSNCLEASSLYAVCCRNECEDLMGHLEKTISAPMASLGRVMELVADLPSDTVVVPRNLSASLLGRLGDIADANAGQIPLHGRLFAQWMHRAFPRECPYPHESGTVSPQTPDEWMKETGDEEHTASEEEIQGHVSNATTMLYIEAHDIELPWSNVEELFANHPAKAKASSESCLWFLLQLLVAVGLMLASVSWIRQHTGTLHYGAGKPAQDPVADLRAVLVLCTLGAAANSAGLIHKATLGCALYGGFVLVALPFAMRSARASAKPESCRV